MGVWRRDMEERKRTEKVKAERNKRGRTVRET